MSESIDTEKVMEDKMQRTMKSLLTVSVRMHTDSILSLIQEDPHQWSSRPCPTCRAIGAMIDRPFGCYLYALQRGKA